MRSVDVSASVAVIPSGRAAPATTATFWRGYWLTLRPYLFFVSGSSGLLGLALAPDLGQLGLAVTFPAFFFAYGLGQAVTDVFQTDTDALSAPYRPLVRGEISRAHVLLVSLLGLSLCALVMALGNTLTLALSGLAVLGLLTYTWFKRRWWGGPFWNAWIVAVLPVIGYLCGGVSPSSALGDRGLAAAGLSVFFSYAVFVLLGYFKDISADRATGYRTLPVVAGWQTSVAVSAFFALAATLSGLALLAQLYSADAVLSATAWASGAMWLAGVHLLVLAHPSMLRLGSEEKAHHAIALAVRGHVLMHFGLAAAVRPGLLLPVAAAYVLFEATLSRRPEATQI